tara:strand:- start:879 stop:1019 length:141 start_codon:yes stop_codon:yes gene_type:complete
MFWKKKGQIDPKTKKVLTEDLKALRNQAVLLAKELENMQKYIEGLR